MKRLFDLALALVAAVLIALPIAITALVVRLTSPGPALYWSDRVGRYNRIFKMPKFRSMRIDTPAVATHLLQNPGQPFTADDVPSPQDPYGVSKLEAEQLLRKIRP